MPSDAVVTELHLHPVKSCRRIEVEEATVGSVGLRGDREWQIIDPDGAPVTQRQHARLAEVQPELVSSGIRLTHGDRSVDVAEPGADTAEAHATSLFGVPVGSRDAGDDAAGWLSDLLGAQVRLVRMTDGGGWEIPPKIYSWRTPMAFVDAGPVLVASVTSHRWLVEQAGEPFPLNRFRPNIVVDGAAPWAEDTWSRFEIGDAECSGTLAWPRCAVPQIDQDSAGEGGPARHSEPARVLRAHRWCDEAPGLSDGLRRIVEGNGLFGVGCDITAPGTVIRVGDELTVTEHQEPLLAPPS